jgi:pyruvate/2-oxoglutarate dehydrogenase complex dihydrolipoamide acyltransferase (E2) component
MVYQLVLPNMEGSAELRVLQWHKTEGDPIEADQMLLELETDKAVVEVRSPKPCVLRKIFVSQGGWAKVGVPLAWFSDSPDEPLDTGKASNLHPLLEIM